MCLVSMIHVGCQAAICSLETFKNVLRYGYRCDGVQVCERKVFGSGTGDMARQGLLCVRLEEAIQHPCILATFSEM